MRWIIRWNVLNPKISYVMITAREDTPYLNRDDLHVFETTGTCMRNQTFKDFEWIIVDARYHERPDFFRENSWGLQIKHVPAQPNVWLDNGLPGVCTQYNKGLVYADGQVVFFTGDSYMFLDGFMELMWSTFLRGYFPLAWYMFDNTYAEGKWRTRGDRDIPESPIPYDILGFKGVNVGLEHRYLKTFSRDYKRVWGVPWLWWFGCSSASLDGI